MGLGGIPSSLSHQVSLLPSLLSEMSLSRVKMSILQCESFGCIMLLSLGAGGEARGEPFHQLCWGWGLTEVLGGGPGLSWRKGVRRWISHLSWWGVGTKLTTLREEEPHASFFSLPDSHFHFPMKNQQASNPKYQKLQKAFPNVTGKSLQYFRKSGVAKQMVCLLSWRIEMKLMFLKQHPGL